MLAYIHCFIKVDLIILHKKHLMKIDFKCIEHVVFFIFIKYFLNLFTLFYAVLYKQTIWLPFMFQLYS